MPHPWTCRRGGLGAGDSTARRLACEALSIFTPIDHAQQLCPHQLSGCLWEQDRAIALVAPAPSPSSNAATPASRGLDLENSLITISGANSLAVCLCRARILLPALGSRSLCAISTVVSLPALQQEPARPRKLRRTIKFASRRDTVQRPVTAGWKNEHERKSSQSDKGALSLLLFPRTMREANRATCRMRPSARHPFSCVRLSTPSSCRQSRSSSIWGAGRGSSPIFITPH